LELIGDTDGVTVSDVNRAAQTEIRGLTSDSREVRTGYLFAALPGAKLDGRQFIKDAVARGAAAVLTPPGAEIQGLDAVILEDKNPRRRFSKLCAGFFGKQVEVVTAVTGTNGKSSTVNFCRQIWRAMDHASASLGTIGIVGTGRGGVELNRPGALTTPDPVVLHSEIAELEASGVTHLAMEASSIGLDQYRLDGLRFTAAGYTNLTRDHLDYHGTMEAYYLSKERLFTEVLEPGAVAVIHADTPYSERLIKACNKRGLRVIDYGREAKDIRLNNRKSLSSGQFIDIGVFGERYELELPLVGEFQAENALCALGLVLAEDPDNRLLHMQGVYALEGLQSVRGRLEFAARLPNGAAIYVDYAHTPDGLETMLKALRPHTPGRLHVVFGCGGDRDRGKRPMMGEIALRLADRVVVTDDNPRTEDPGFVRGEIMAALTGPAAKGRVVEVGGRRDAIKSAIRALQSGDVLVIAGKGHEQGQIVGKEVLPFDDVSEARAAALESTK
jgi:UDP-N-acetylmuramoyl-L-alanyl-D-glutamate--2,6-diaminopimelate ligase